MATTIGHGAQRYAGFEQQGLVGPAKIMKGAQLSKPSLRARRFRVRVVARGSRSLQNEKSPSELGTSARIVRQLDPGEIGCGAIR